MDREIIVQQKNQILCKIQYFIKNLVYSYSFYWNSWLVFIGRSFKFEVGTSII